MNQHFYLLSVYGPYAWGLASEWVINGWNCRRQTDGLISIDRTGPYVPIITMPRLDCVIVNSEFKQWLDTGAIGHFEFRRVIKNKIVELDWQLWNEDSDEDIVMPADVDLGTYFANREHSLSAAEKMGELWEWVIPRGAMVDTDIEESEFVSRKRVHLSTWNGSHTFRGVIRQDAPDTAGWPIVDQFAKDMLESQAIRYLLFKECLVLA